MLLAGGAAALLAVAGWLLADMPLAGALAGLVLVLAWELRVQLRAAGELSQLFDAEAWSGGAFSFAELPQQLSDLESRTEEAEQRLRKVLKALRSTARSFPDAALVLNDQGDVMVSNREARRMLGVRKRLDKGRPALKLIRDPEFRNWLERGGKNLVRFKSPENPDNWLEAQRVPYAEKQFLLLVRDVTASVLADQTRSDFVANASHELQTPLTVLTGYLESMSEDQEFPERWTDPVRNMSLQCDRMTRLVRDLLELSRLETSETPPGIRAAEHDGSAWRRGAGGDGALPRPVGHSRRRSKASGHCSAKKRRFAPWPPTSPSTPWPLLRRAAKSCCAGRPAAMAGESPPPIPASASAPSICRA